MKKKTMTLIKMSAVAVGCAAILGVSAANLPVHALADIQVPAENTKVQVSISEVAGVKEDVKLLTSTSKYLTTEIKVPQLTGMLDKHYQEEMNYIILSHAEKDLAQWEKDANEAAAKAKSDHQEFLPYNLTISYNLKSDGTGSPAGIVSLEVITEGSMGGTSMPRIDTYNVKNTSAAERVTLPYLLGDNYKEKLDADILAQIQKDPDKYVVKDYKGTSVEQTFYVEKGDLVIVFPKYSIAPGYVGSPEFRFSLKDQPAEETKPEEAVKLHLEKVENFKNSQGITMVSLRDVAKQLNYEVKWNKADKTAELVKGTALTSVSVGKDSYSIAKMSPKALGAAPVLQNNKLFVPVQFVTEILKVEVQQ
ncbi:stalk domain-containing protein [Paenibacillus sp.]|uniref:stalk domain-containing protein n=1 Tax=Paenibacillus sp. TaxID=58172 RepID=UPI002830D7A5|nr:stalk domain-containing protein [Paenibacillus sp.]MDR0271511.1 DUF3298 domain-containing protein [Paenibacillus sp.]